MKKSWVLAISCFVLITVVLMVYMPVMKTFYQQDEWLGYGLYLAKGPGIILQSTGGFWGIIFGQGRLLANFLLFLFYKYFPLNVFPIAIFAVVFHLVNILIVFFLAKKIFKKILPAFLGSMFFALNSVSQSAVTWAAASINTLPSTTLILVAIVFYFKYLESSKGKHLFISFVLIYVSLFFKETGVFLFLLLPIFSFFYKKQRIYQFFKTNWYFLIATILIVMFRIAGFRSVAGQEALFLTGSSKYFFDSLIVRSILYPLTSFSLSLIPPTNFLNFARYITNVYYPFIPESQFILVAQTVVLDLLSILLTFVIVFVLTLVLTITESKTRKTIIFWLIFLFVNFLPYVIISKNFSYLESRYYYLASAAWSIIFVWFLSLVFQRFKNLLVKSITILIFILFLYFNASTVVLDINRSVSESQTRISILNQIAMLKPKLDSKKNIFYVTGDADFYLMGNKIPFQQGFGYTLMSLYYNFGKIPKELLNDQFLFEINSQGYKEVNGLGFGYFSNLQDLKLALTENNLSKDVVMAFYYNSKQNKMRDVSIEVGY